MDLGVHAPPDGEIQDQLQQRRRRDQVCDQRYGKPRELPRMSFVRRAASETLHGSGRSQMQPTHPLLSRMQLLPE
jgi:hypothetical protein